MTENRGPLAGVTVIDLTEFIFGPYATQTLGDLGAEVIKIESPDGDRQRHGAKHATNADMGSIFMTLNRNKRSVTLDLKTEEGRAKLRALIPDAHVFIHNVRADAMARLGFAYEDVAKINPSIVYVHCVGYGSDGPYAGRQAFDDLVQAASGAADLLPRVDGNEDMRLLPSYRRRQGVEPACAVGDAGRAVSPRTHGRRPVRRSADVRMLHQLPAGRASLRRDVRAAGRHVGHTPALAADRRPLKTQGRPHRHPAGEPRHRREVPGARRHSECLRQRALRASARRASASASITRCCARRRWRTRPRNG